MEKPALCFIGGGNMARSLIGGLINQGYPASAITVSEPIEERRNHLADTFGVSVAADNNTAVTGAALVILAVKPQVIKTVAQALRPALAHRPIVVSIAAGININSLQNWLGNELPIVRCMPNTPALVQTGATGVYANALASSQQRQFCAEILNAVGVVSWVETEDDIDTVTAISGSGPAYYFLVMEIMEKVAVEMGLPEHAARQLVQQTALGAAKMALASDADTAELRRRVTSPNGTTERALNTLGRGDFEGLFRSAIVDCRKRAVELASELGDDS